MQMRWMLVGLVSVLLHVQASGQEGANPGLSIDDMVRIGVERIVAMEEGETSGQWPYEGVYRVAREIPVGYRIGGTAIACMAMALCGEGEDEQRQAATARGLGFIMKGIEHPLMNPEYDGGYDVRGWGYTYALMALVELEKRGLIPADMKDDARRVAAWYVKAIEATEIPQSGGWNYARARGKDAVSPSSPFMTGPTLQALFVAAELGYEVDAGVVDRALAALERGRAESGEIVYAGEASERRAGGVPGAMGRMMVAETTLVLAGRSGAASVRGGVDAFFVHWDWFEKRRAKPGTHEPPYGVAPYYFYFAHLAAGQAIEQLPPRERAEYRRRLAATIITTRAEDGTWNDRVFDRSAAYGTSMAVLALRADRLALGTRWTPKALEEAPSSD